MPFSNKKRISDNGSTQIKRKVHEQSPYVYSRNKKKEKCKNIKKPEDTRELYNLSQTNKFNSLRELKESIESHDSEPVGCECVRVNSNCSPKCDLLECPNKNDHTTCQRLGNDFWNEKYRLRTFIKYPKSAAKSAIYLSNAGFIYTGTGQDGDTRVTCVFCGVTIKSCNLLCDLEQFHKSLSPECPMVSGSSSANISFNSSVRSDSNFDVLLQEAERLGSLLQTDYQPSALEEMGAANSFKHCKNSCEKSSHKSDTPTLHHQYYQEISSLQSERNSAVNAIHDLPENLTSFLMSQRNENTTTPDNISLTVSSQREATAVLSLQPDHMQTNGSQTQSIESNRSSNSLHSLSNSVTSSTTPETRSSTTSLNSNTNIPASTTSNEHSPAKPSSQRNPTYSELGIITDRPKRVEYALTSERLKSFSSWPRGHFLEPTDLVNAGFYYSGNGDCARCFYCGGGLKNWEDEDDVLVEHARWFSKCAYIRSKMGQAFVDAVKVVNESHDVITFKMVTDQMGGQACSGQLDPRDNPLIRDPAVKTMVDLGYKEFDALEIAQLLKDREMTLTADLLIETLTQEGKVAQTNFSNFDQETTFEEDLEKVRLIKETNLHLRQQTVCKMCLDNEVSVVFLPCGHLVSCSECSSAVSKCPMCRADVKGIVRAFLS
uniref:RING-type domain-containing protein n=1 Tax=Biomphalaria glabrata TaxID=6526 RepID=A0A9I3VTV8_BIOGL